MRWNIIVECVGEDGQRSTTTVGSIEWLAASTTAENLGVNLRESKQIANRLQDTVVKRQLQERCEQRRKCLTRQAAAGQRFALPDGSIRSWGPCALGFRDMSNLDPSQWFRIA